MDKYHPPGRHTRKGISIFQLTEMFPDEASAERWFEEQRWPDERACPKCGCMNTSRVKNRKPMPFWCRDCRSYFSVKYGTPMQSSKISLRKWVFGLYMLATNLKSVSSMKLHRDLGVCQKTAWFMSQRIRQAWARGAWWSMVEHGCLRARSSPGR